MIYLTGDVHGHLDWDKLNTKNFPEQKNLTRDDYVIILGDFGLLWKNDNTYQYLLKEWKSKRYTVLWLDGNHENHAWINKLPVSEWNGGKVHIIDDNIIHLMRGQVFALEDKKFFVCGGAASYDRMMRVEGISWWPEENVSYAEQEEAISNLERYNNKVDFILTHTCPITAVIPIFHKEPMENDPTGKFLNFIWHTVKFDDWYFGHWHEDVSYENLHCLYHDVIRVN